MTTQPLYTARSQPIQDTVFGDFNRDTLERKGNHHYRRNVLACKSALIARGRQHLEPLSVLARKLAARKNPAQSPCRGVYRLNDTTEVESEYSYLRFQESVS
jgi:hypothetical protein